MVEATKDKEYINYKDYSSYKTRFSRVNESSIDTNKLKELINKSTEDSNIRNNFTKVFKELYRHLKHDGIFFDYSPKACLYISYILHKVVQQEIKELYFPDLYEALRQFVIQYNQDRSNNNNNNNCINDMVYIDYDLFQEMYALYRVYDEYYDFEAYNYNPNIFTCGKLDKLILLYKDYIKGKESKSKNFNNILTHLEMSFKETLQKHDPQCSKKNTPLPQLKLFNPPEEKPPRVQKPEDTTHSSTSVQTVSQESPQGLPEGTNSQTYPEETQIVLPQGHSNDVVDQGRVEEAKIEQQTRSEEKKRKVEGQRTSEFSLNTQSPVQHRFSETLESPGQLGFIGTAEYLIRPDIQSETGALEQMKNTLSNVLGSVDPAPVLGVSGGMGVLFLLFKYTPVGSFFGGRRRRFRQIPSSFGGFTPGEFPNFQEYGVGHVGYSPMDIPHFAE
ncbi:PIR protein [Plasmodium vivax]|uniref:VIR protein n=1 Tax=Plasmodium vivax TaxID=5855 RepID=A0A565A5Y2_PLAVI|nr:PIR protein [Plasmodium vivax]